MKNEKSTKTLMSFADSSMNLSEMKKVKGGGLALCRVPRHEVILCPPLL
jgi:hypothetical protein